MMKPVRSCVIVISGILLFLGGHAFATTPSVKAEPETGMPFGAFDITESDLAVTHVVLMRIKPLRPLWVELGHSTQFGARAKPRLRSRPQTLCRNPIL
jgi:hypothetical protein